MLAPAANIRLANVGGDLVFLDLALDEYFSIGADAAAAAISAVKGEPYEPDEIICELIGAGILNPGAGVSSVFLDRPRPIDCPQVKNAQLRVGEFLDLCLTAFSVARVVRARPPENWPRKTLRPRQEPISDVEIFELAARFRTWRCLVPGTGRCLIQSMILTRMLRRRGIACEWVFGVRTHPFAAHCWVEACGYVLNDFADYVAWYVPIAVL